MKIGIITTSFPRWRGDYAGVFVYEAARAIQREGIQVKVITMHSPGTTRSENWDGIEILRTKYLPDSWELLKSEGGGLPEVWKNNPKARIQIIPFFFAFLYDVLRYTRDCDLLHANWTLAGVIAWINNLLVRKRYFVTIQGSDIYKAIELPFITSITRLSLNKAKKVIVLSHALAMKVNSIGIHFSKIEIIPNGVDTCMFLSSPFENRSNHILFVGSIINRKGIIFLIQAFSQVVKNFPDLNLIIIGEGNQQSECEDLIRSLEISDRVVFTGAQTQEQVATAMRKSKVFVLPSIEEGLGVVLLEALASGTPVVASNVGGISDVIDERVGILVQPGDPRELEEAIITILTLSPEKWNTLQQNARKRAEEVYDWNQVTKRIVRLYTD